MSCSLQEKKNELFAHREDVCLVARAGSWRLFVFCCSSLHVSVQQLYKGPFFELCYLTTESQYKSFFLFVCFYSLVTCTKSRQLILTLSINLFLKDVFADNTKYLFTINKLKYSITFCGI